MQAAPAWAQPAVSEQLIDQQHIEYEVTNGLNRPLSFRLACLSCDWVA